jgi:hypothetical protein
MSNAGVTLLHSPLDGECRYCAKLVGDANQDEPCDGAAPLRRALWTIAHDCNGWARELARHTLEMGEEAAPTPPSEESSPCAHERVRDLNRRDVQCIACGRVMDGASFYGVTENDPGDPNMGAGGNVWGDR